MHGISDRLQAQFRFIAEHARVVTGSPRATLLLYDETVQRLVTVATAGADVPLQQIAIDLIRRNYPGLDPLDLAYRPTINPDVGAAFIHQRTQVATMAEAFENIFPPGVIPLAHGLVGITHVVTCPVVAEGRALGLIRFLVAGPPTDPQQALMEAAASQIGLTLSNAELAEQTRRQLAATRAIGEVARLGASAGMSVMLQALVVRVRELTEADAALVYLADASGEIFRPAAESLTDAARVADIGRMSTPERRIGRGLVGWVIAAGEAAFIPDVRVDPRTQTRRIAQAREAAIAVPMRAGGRTIGCLRISVTGHRRFTEADLWLAQTLADEAAAALETAERQELLRAAARSEGAAALVAIEQPLQELLRLAVVLDGGADDRNALRAAAEQVQAELQRIQHASHNAKEGKPTRQRASHRD